MEYVEALMRVFYVYLHCYHRFLLNQFYLQLAGRNLGVQSKIGVHNLNQKSVSLISCFDFGLHAFQILPSIFDTGMRRQYSLASLYLPASQCMPAI